MTTWRQDGKDWWLEALDDCHSGCWRALLTLLHDIDDAIFLSSSSSTPSELTPFLNPFV